MSLGTAPLAGTDPVPIVSTNIGVDGKFGGLGGLGLSIKPPVHDVQQQQNEEMPGLHYIPVKT